MNCKHALKYLMFSLIGVFAGLMAVVFSSIYQVTFYFCAISFVIMLIFIITALIRHRFPRVSISSFVVVTSLMSLLILWIKLTTGVELYRDVNLRFNQRAKNRIVIKRMNDKLDTHAIFYGAKSVEKAIQRDSIVHIDEFEYVFGVSCRENIEDAAKTIFISRDTTRIYSPWHGYKVFCEEYLGSNFVRLNGQDTITIYSNAIISSKFFPKNRITLSLVHMDDIMYAAVNGN